MSTPFDLIITNGTFQAGMWRTNDAITPSQGYGGHPVASRPKRRALTVWQGRQPFMLKIPAVLYRGGIGHSVEVDRTALDEMAITEDLVSIHDQKGVRVETGPGVILPIPHQIEGCEWWIEDMTWGEEIREGPEGPYPGHMIRKNLEVTLLERIDDVTLGEHDAQSSTSTKARPMTNNYTVKKGDTLHSIAKARLGDAKRWKEIVELNKNNPTCLGGHCRSDSSLIVKKTVLRLPGKGVTYTSTTLPGIEGVLERFQPTSGGSK